MDKEKPGFIRRLFKGLVKFVTALRLLVVNLLFLLVLVIVFLGFSGGEIPKIPERGALILDLKGSLVDQASYVDPLQRLMGGVTPEQDETLLQDVIDAIRYAGDDERINTLVLQLDDLAFGGISKIQEIAMVLEEFRRSGKKIIAIGDNYSQDQYLLASHADEVYLHPMGGVSITGYGVYRSYYKKALDKMEINFHVFRVGNYKSALEPMMRESMSDDSRESNLAWLNSLWGEYVSTISTRRNLSPDTINDYANKFDQVLAEHQGDGALAAAATGLVDAIVDRDEINQQLINEVGAADDEGLYQGISFERYLWIRNIELPNPAADGKIAVVVASGMILDGDWPPGYIGGDSLVQLIRQVRRDESIDAVVLRVDSGGGSAFASEVIRRELALLKQQGRPLVVSMGSAAASGGYWISALADEIWAMPTTLTGSIGIFSAFPTIEKTLGKLGISNDGVGTTAMADAGRIDRPLNSVFGRAMQSSLENGYTRFLTIVANGRGMTTEQVDGVAQGRVWSGADAFDNGLVDQLGGLDQAVAAAAKLANLTEYKTELVELPLTPQQQFLQELMGSEVMLSWLAGIYHNPQSLFSQINRWIIPFGRGLEFIDNMNDPQNMYLHCSACAEL
ncbi:MAG: signal peptide peptidase SppA [Oceanicoccus sp.]